MLVVSRRLSTLSVRYSRSLLPPLLSASRRRITVIHWHLTLAATGILDLHQRLGITAYLRLGSVGANLLISQSRS